MQAIRAASRSPLLRLLPSSEAAPWGSGGRSPSRYSWSATVERHPPRCRRVSPRGARPPPPPASPRKDDRLGSAGDLRRANEAVQLLDLLDRVARDAGPQRLLDDAVEVDEHLLPEPVVDLVLARRVLAHEPLERGLLVPRVVVDVQIGVHAAARLAPVDEALERGLLAARRGTRRPRIRGGRDRPSPVTQRRGTRARSR